MSYDAAYFIAKFEAIPEELWTVNFDTQGKKHCARGHCDFMLELGELYRVMNGSVAGVNDGDSPDYPQPTPRARILAALRDAKEAGR